MPATPSRRSPWVRLLLVLLVVLAVCAPVALLSRAGAVTTGTGRLPGVPTAPRSPSAPAVPSVPALPHPNGSGPNGSGPNGTDPNGGSAIPTPDPSAGLLQTPPALAALGYRAATLRQVSPTSVASNAGEVAEFARDGLESITSMELLAIRRPGGAYLASVYVLPFHDHAGAASELAYSTKANHALGLKDLVVPGVPGAVGLLDTRTGAPDAEDFVVVGSRQLFAAVRPLSSSTTTAQVGAEAAAVLKALVRDADAIRPPAAAPTIPNAPGAPSTPAIPSVPAPELPSPAPSVPGSTASAQPA